LPLRRWTRSSALHIQDEVITWTGGGYAGIAIWKRRRSHKSVEATPPPLPRFKILLGRRPADAMEKLSPTSSFSFILLFLLIHPPPPPFLFLRPPSSMERTLPNDFGVDLKLPNYSKWVKCKICNFWRKKIVHRKTSWWKAHQNLGLSNEIKIYS
jgi:hypothetical protein